MMSLSLPAEFVAVPVDCRDFLFTKQNKTRRKGLLREETTCLDFNLLDVVIVMLLLSDTEPQTQHVSFQTESQKICGAQKRKCCTMLVLASGHPVPSGNV